MASVSTWVNNNRIGAQQAEDARPERPHLVRLARIGLWIWTMSYELRICTLTEATTFGIFWAKQRSYAIVQSSLLGRNGFLCLISLHTFELFFWLTCWFKPNFNPIQLFAISIYNQRKIPIFRIFYFPECNRIVGSLIEPPTKWKWHVVIARTRTSSLEATINFPSTRWKCMISNKLSGKRALVVSISATLDLHLLCKELTISLCVWVCCLRIPCWDHDLCIDQPTGKRIHWMPFFVI